MVRSVLECIHIHALSLSLIGSPPIHPSRNCLKNLLSECPLETKNGIGPSTLWQSNAITEIQTYLMVVYKDHIKHPECANVEQIHTGNKGQGEQSKSSGSSMRMYNLFVLSVRTLRLVTTLSHAVAVLIPESIIWGSDSHFRKTSGYRLHRYPWCHFSSCDDFVLNKSEVPHVQ